MIVQDKLKALVAAAVSFLVSWAALRFPMLADLLTPEIQASIVGIVSGLLVYHTPNIPPAEPPKP